MRQRVQKKDDLRARLQDAALSLYCARGYERTTTAEIAALAGVTERTFFRYFPDKREVLFDEDPRLRATLEAASTRAPPTTAPLEVMLLAFRSIEHLLVENRSFTEPRAAIIATTPALQERADAKAASLVTLLATALQQRGVEEKLAMLAARTGMAAFGYAAHSWFQKPSQTLSFYLDGAFAALRLLSSQGASASASPSPTP